MLTLMMGSSFGISPHQQLSRIALAVAYAIDNQPQCVLGVALMNETATHFGYALSPRAVSMVGQAKANPSRPIVTGELSRQFVVDQGGSGQVEIAFGVLPDGSEFQRAGHMVSTLERPGILSDPTFGQFTRAGLPDRVVVQAYDPSWFDVQVEDEAMKVLYLFDDQNTGWQASFEHARRESTAVAADLAQHLKTGGHPHTHDIRLKAPSPNRKGDVEFRFSRTQ